MKQIEKEFLKMKIPESYLVWAKKYMQISLESHTTDISEQKSGLQRQLTKLEEKEKGNTDIICIELFFNRQKAEP